MAEATTIRQARSSDLEAILRLLDAAFTPSTYESALVKLVALAQGPAHAWVAETDEGGLAGYVLYTPATREGAIIGWHLAPVAVMPEWQGRGIGSALIRQTLSSPALEKEAIFVLGDPAFYERFGFGMITEAICPYDEANRHFRALRWRGESGGSFTIGYIPAFEAASRAGEVP